MKKYTEVFEDIDPNQLEDDDLVHVEVDPDGVSHIYSTANLPSRDHVYHPEWDEHWDNKNS